MSSNFNTMRFIYGLILTVFFIEGITGHGMLWDPPNRSSLWRFDHSAPPNYEDDQNFCGGITEQWEYFEGKCGVCGDRYDAPHPQPNENTGKFGRGKVVRTYQSGTVIDVIVNLTTSHLGYFNLSLCVLTDPSVPEPGEDCFQPLYFADGGQNFYVPGDEGDVLTINSEVRLPESLKCDRCVLRWNYKSGNNWGQCDDGHEGMGCGPQEMFRSCSDIAIV